MRACVPQWLALAVALTALSGCAQSGGSTDKPEPKTVEAPAPPLFKDVTAASGIRFTYRNGEDSAKHLAILQSLGGGVGLIDYDGDGRLDVYLPGGGGFAGPDTKQIVGYPGKLFRNLGGGRFEDATAAAGLDHLAGNTPWFYSHGTAVADYDRDGWPDLLVTGYRRIVLFRNVPVDPNDPRRGRRFSDVTTKAGLDRGIDWATSAAFADLDGDGYPDLYVCQYVDWSWAKNPSCSYDGKTSDVCPPKSFDGLPHRLFRNTGRGGFLDVTKEAGLRPGGPGESKGLGVLAVDFDGDARPDLYVANDTVDNYLYLNRSRPGQIRLEEKGLLAAVARDVHGNANGSMGLDAGDPDRAGKPALWVTNYQNELHALYRNESKTGQMFFHYHTAGAGIGAIGQSYVGWGTGFLDADLDGWEDLVVSNGHAIRFPGGHEANRWQRPVLMLNRAGKFRPATARLGSYAERNHLGRGLAIGDLDDDGRADLVFANMNEPAAVLRGIGGEGCHWLGVQLVGKDHACVVGARVTLTIGDQRLTRFARGGGSYASSGDRRLLFGLGSERPGRLTVTWPDGAVQHFDALQPDRYHRLVQGADRPRPTAPMP